MFVALVVMNMTAEYYETRTRMKLTRLDEFGERLFGCASGMAATHRFVVAGTGVRRMVEDEKNEVQILREVVHLRGEPLALRAGKFLEVAIKDKEQRIGNAGGIVTTVLQIREALEVVAESDLQIAVQFVISDGGVDGYFVFAPDGG